MGRRERQAAKRQQRWGQIAIGILLVLLMVLSILQFGGNGNGQGLSFEGHRFEVVESGFATKTGSGTLITQSVPLERNGSAVIFQSSYGPYVRVETDPGSVELLTGAPLFVFAFDPSSPGADIIDLLRLDLSQRLGNVAGAILEANDSYPSFPVIGCENASNAMPVARFLLSNAAYQEANMTLEGSCVTVVGDALGLVAAKDYLLLADAGVISRGS